MDEAATQNHTRLEFAKIGPIWRNNSGAFQDASGRLIRYGLGNDTAALNSEIKSSDLIGITPVTAYLASVGQWVTLGVFTALEVKPTAWRPRPSDTRAAAQERFHKIVRDVGGFAGFVNEPGQIHQIIKRF